jgi:hypothetical protein
MRRNRRISDQVYLQRVTEEEQASRLSTTSRWPDMAMSLCSRST